MIKKMMVLLAATLVALAVTVARPSVASAAPTGTDVVVYVGQLGASTYEQSLNGVLYTENQIGGMADRILWTEEQIGIMADRIVYVTEVSQDNTVKVIYMVTALWATGTQDGGYLYQVALMPVALLPAGW